MDDAPPAGPALSTEPVEPVEPDRGPEVVSLDRLLRPPDRTDAWRAALGRLQHVDRRVLIGSTILVVLIAGVIAVLVSRTPASPSAAVSLPRAQRDEPATDGSTGGSSATGGRTVATAAATTTSSGSVVVDVAGAVVHPGLVSIPSGSRVADAVAAAGGFRPDADSDRVNLASPISDGVRVYVAAIGQTSIPVPIGPNGGGGGGGPSVGVGGATATTVPAPVDLNTATADQLDALPGVGPSTAQAILAYRSAHGSFGSVDDLDQVRGIGPAKLSQLRDLVTVG